MLIPIEGDDLFAVAGGQNTVITSSPQGERTTTRSDYAYCVDAVTQACRAASPGTLWGTNEAKAGQCTVQNLPAACGQPPVSTGGQ